MIRKNKISKVASAVCAVAILTGGIPPVAETTIHEPIVISASAATLETAAKAPLHVSDAKKKARKSATKTFYRVPKGSGYVFITDKISYQYDGKKVYNVKVKQSCDNTIFGYHSSGTKVDKVAKDGSITVHSSYYVRECVTGFVSKVIGFDIPIGLKSCITYNYKINKDGKVTQLKNTNKKIRIYSK